MKYHISKPNKITTTYKFYLWSVCNAGTERPIRDILESMRNGQDVYKRQGKKSKGKPRYHFEALEKKQDV